MNKRLVIFTDLDGTLLDSGYSFAKAKPALDLLKKNKIPLILCSSKTRTEIEYYRKKLKNNHPFISENGGGIFIPKEYFKSQISNLKSQIERKKKYDIIRLGAGYADLRNALKGLRSEGFDVRGFGDMSAKEIAELTGLKINEARMAKQRDFDEPFVFNGSSNEVEKLFSSIRAMGFRYTKGEFFHITGNSDKGRAVEILKKIYMKQYHKLVTVGIGDSPNDLEMLEKVDYPIIVKKSDEKYNLQLIKKFKRSKKLVKAEGVGPEGWNKAVMKLLKVLCKNQDMITRKSALRLASAGFFC